MKTPKPEPKKFNLRLPVDLMEEAQAQAEAMGISLNAYCILAIRNFVEMTQAGKPKLSSRERTAVQRMAGEAPSKAMKPTSHTPSKTLPKVGRNDLCPCGSGRKAKHCHPEAC